MRNETPNIQKISLSNSLGSIAFIGVMIAVMPKTAKRLKILEPIKFPNEMAFSFLSIAMTEAANSGILVPTETTVTPIARSLTPYVLARPTDP